MPTPLLIDTDTGIDDAVAIALALNSRETEVVGLVSVGGNVDIDQATGNVTRLLRAFQPPDVPAVARGLDQVRPDLKRATHVFGADGLGELGLAAAPGLAPGEFLDLYEQVTTQYPAEVVIVAVGPLTNLAAVLQERHEVLSKAARIIVMGGAIWCPGNVTPHAEFNFYRDPEAAAAVLSSGLPITVVPLDVTRQVGIDESHLAHLSRSGGRTGELLARMIRWPLEHGSEAASGKFLVHDALALGVLFWPQLFMQARMGLEVVASGPQAGRCRPAVAKDKLRQLGVVISVNVVDFLENLLEELCHERFVV